MCFTSGAKLEITSPKSLFQSEFLRKVIANVSKQVKITFLDQIDENESVQIPTKYQQNIDQIPIFPGFWLKISTTQSLQYPLLPTTHSA